MKLVAIVSFIGICQAMPRQRPYSPPIEGEIEPECIVAFITYEPETETRCETKHKQNCTIITVNLCEAKDTINEEIYTEKECKVTETGREICEDVTKTRRIAGVLIESEDCKGQGTVCKDLDETYEDCQQVAKDVAGLEYDVIPIKRCQGKPDFICNYKIRQECETVYEIICDDLDRKECSENPKEDCQDFIYADCST